MSRCLGLPTLNIDFLKATGFEFDVVGSSIEGGRNAYGETISIGITGGGLVRGSYAFIVHEPEQIEYINWLGARLNSSTRFINVPIRSDFVGPFPVVDQDPAPFIIGIPHSDGALFSDEAGYSQATVWGRVRGATALNAGKMEIEIVGNTRDLRWSDWFSIYHGTKKGWRAYRYWEASEPEAVTVVTGGVSYPGQRYTLSIAPALREYVPHATPIEFARPRFVAKFPVDFTLPFRADLLNRDRPTVQFVEGF